MHIAPAQASQVYTVAKLDVDVTAADAVSAKEQALAAAQQRALRKVLKRIAPFGAEDRLPRVDRRTADNMVASFSVRREAFSGNRYIATLDFEFQQDAVRQLLSGYGIEFDDSQAPETHVLPVLMSGGEALGERENAWRQAWQGLDLANALTPVRLVESGADASTLQAVLAGDGSAFRSLQRQSGADRLVLAVAEMQDGRLATRLIGRDNSGYVDVRRDHRVYERASRSAEARAAAIAFRVIESRWKITDSTAGGNGEAAAPSAVRLRVEFFGMREWQDIRSRLVDVPGVQALEVGALSARSAEVSFMFAGDAERLNRQLATRDLSLRNEGGGWVLRGD